MEILCFYFLNFGCIFMEGSFGLNEFIFKYIMYKFLILRKKFL